MTDTLEQKKTSFVTISVSQYGLLKTRPHNRPINEKGVKTMLGSVERNGVLRYPIIVWNQKKSHYEIIDGQHLITAIKQLELPIKCIVVEDLSEAEIVQLMIDLNNISRSWKLEDYIRSWKESGKKDYRILSSTHKETYPDLQITVLMQAYAQTSRGVATNLVKNGEFTIVDKIKGDDLLDNLAGCGAYLPNSRQVNESLIKLMISVEDYNQTRMLTNLRKRYKSLDMVHTKESSVYAALLNVYNGK